MDMVPSSPTGEPPSDRAMLVALHVLIQAGLIVRALLRPHRDPASRVAWVTVILVLPVLGAVLYVLVGETNIGRRRAERVRRVEASLPAQGDVPGLPAAVVDTPLPDHLDQLFRVGRSISGYDAVRGNAAVVADGPDDAIDRLVADIDAARETVHLLFYIWLPDGTGTRVAEALVRAAGRGVRCRAMVDDIGSRALVRSPVWSTMESGGVRLARVLKVGNPILRALDGRVDIRNHRKIVVVDNRVTWCGSRNCADPEFLPKARYAPWVDLFVRFEGPVARQNQFVFAADWMAVTGEDVRPLLTEPLPPPGDGFPAQVVVTGPTGRWSAAPEMFAALLWSARREIVVTTPYYVPVEAMQSALCAAANRGVRTVVVFPARNDNFAVGAASRSFYADLLAAGVEIHEFLPGLLHAKTLTVDGEAVLIGSANMDRRSFDLNYENNILAVDAGLVVAIRHQQDAWIAASRPVTADEVAAWPWWRRLWHNAMGIVGPLL
jgi:cardiolipin synthase